MTKLPFVVKSVINYEAMELLDILWDYCLFTRLAFNPLCIAMYRSYLVDLVLGSGDHGLKSTLVTPKTLRIAACDFT